MTGWGPDGAAWREANRANWDERVDVHQGTEMYELASLRDGTAGLLPLEEDELWSVDGLKVAHLQCHFGRDSFVLSQRGARITGLDFSEPAIELARSIATDLGVEASFVQADVYDALSVLEPGSFDLVYVTWGALGWLPDIRGWAHIVAQLLRPGGRLYLAEGHPAAFVFDDATAGADGWPGRYVPYFHDEPLCEDSTEDYADPTARLKNTRTFNWVHPVGHVVGGLLSEGMRLDVLNEHDGVPWQMFSCLVRHDDGLWRWPDKAWLPLSYSLGATRV